MKLLTNYDFFWGGGWGLENIICFSRIIIRVSAAVTKSHLRYFKDVFNTLMNEM